MTNLKSFEDQYQEIRMTFPNKWACGGGPQGSPLVVGLGDTREEAEKHSRLNDVNQDGWVFITFAPWRNNS